MRGLFFYLKSGAGDSAAGRRLSLSLFSELDGIGRVGFLVSAVRVSGYLLPDAGVSTQEVLKIAAPRIVLRRCLELLYGPHKRTEERALFTTDRLHLFLKPENSGLFTNETNTNPRLFRFPATKPPSAAETSCLRVKLTNHGILARPDAASRETNNYFFSN